MTGPEAGLTRDSITRRLRPRPAGSSSSSTPRGCAAARASWRAGEASTGDTIRAMKFAEAVVVVLDAPQPFEKQDLQILDLVAREGRAVVIALNKWDLVEDPDATIRAAREAATRLIPQAAGLRVVPVSALSGRGVDRLIATMSRRWSAGRRGSRPGASTAGSRRP